MPTASWPDYEFRYRSYERETAYEILIMLQTRKKDAKDILEEYRDNIKSFMRIKDDGIAGMILDVALETTEDILLKIEKEIEYESIKKTTA